MTLTTIEVVEVSTFRVTTPGSPRMANGATRPSTRPPQNIGAYWPDTMSEATDAAPSGLPELTMMSMVASTTISIADRITWLFYDATSARKRSRSVIRPTKLVKPLDPPTEPTPRTAPANALFHGSG